MNFKETVDAFKASCRAYQNEKENLLKLRASKDSSPVYYQLYKCVQEDVDFVEKTLDMIDHKCGPNARLMVYMLFVEERTQVDVAKTFGVTRRQVQYSLDKWLRQSLEYDEHGENDG